MDEAAMVLLCREFLAMTLQVSGPVLAVAVAVGLAVSIGQVVTSIQDATLAYVLRLAGVGAVLIFLGRWMLNLMVLYTTDLWAGIPGRIH